MMNLHWYDAPTAVWCLQKLSRLQVGLFYYWDLQFWPQPLVWKRYGHDFQNSNNNSSNNTIKILVIRPVFTQQPSDGLSSYFMGGDSLIRFYWIVIIGSKLLLVSKQVTGESLNKLMFAESIITCYYGINPWSSRKLKDNHGAVFVLVDCYDCAVNAE